MSKKSKRKADLKSSLLILLLIAILLIASTYAWFTANKTVTVSELEVNVQAKNGLQISADGTNWKSVLDIADLLPTALADTYSTNTNQIPDSMEPISTIGQVTTGKLDLFYGNVAAKDGGYALTATKETDTQGTEGRYVAFDIFLRVDQESQIALTPESKVVFKAKLLNNSEIEVFAYDNIADYIYQKNLEIFFLRGKLRENMQVEIIEIYDFKFLD